MKPDSPRDTSWRSGWPFAITLLIAIPTLISAAFAVLVAGLMGLATLFRSPSNPMGAALMVLAGLGSWAVLALACAVWVRREDWVVKGGLWVGLALKTWLLGISMKESADLSAKFPQINMPSPWFAVMSWLLVVWLLIRPSMSGRLGTKLQLFIAERGLAVKPLLDRWRK